MSNRKNDQKYRAPDRKVCAKSRPPSAADALMQRSERELVRLRSVLRLCSRKGLKIIPIAPRSKVPMAGYSSRKPFSSWTETNKFLTENSEANFAAATGSLSGFFVVDVDGAEGKSSIQKLAKQNGGLGKSVRVKTPRGWHLWYSCPKVPVGNSASRIAPHIDVRGDGGYVLLPGSIGPNREKYQFIKGRGLEDVEIGPAPEWVVSLVTSPSKAIVAPSDGMEQRGDGVRKADYGTAALTDECQKLSALQEGQRNDGLNKASFRMGQLVVAGRLDESEAEFHLLRAALSGGLSEAESVATITSGLTAGKAESAQRYAA